MVISWEGKKGTVMAERKENKAQATEL